MSLWFLERPNARVSLLAVADPTLRRSHLGPLLDRIDIHIDVPAVKFRELAGDVAPDTDSSAVIRHRVITARQRQLRRFKAKTSSQRR